MVLDHMGIVVPSLEEGMRQWEELLAIERIQIL